jgi:hypothetical protein
MPTNAVARKGIEFPNFLIFVSGKESEMGAGRHNERESERKS